MGDLSFERILREAAAATHEEALAYLVGATHDGTLSRIHRTTRFCQADPRWLTVLEVLLGTLGHKGWSYREGSQRNLWVLETSWRPPPNLRLASREEQQSYTLEDLHGVLEILGIACGRLHNPSRRVDPDYWRFFVTAASHVFFARTISSWHPRKRALLDGRLAAARETELRRGCPAVEAVLP